MSLDEKEYENTTGHMAFYTDDIKQSIKECIADEHINSDGEVINRLRKIFGKGLI